MKIEPTLSSSWSPIRIWFILSCAIFFCEALVMLLLDLLPERSLWTSVFIDPILLSVLIVPLLYFLVFRPFTTYRIERKQTEESLKAITVEQRLILNATPAHIWLKDTENRALKVNTSVAAYLGLSVEDVEGKYLHELFPAKDAEQIYQGDLEIIHTGQPKLGVIEERRLLSGELRWLRVDKVPHLDEQGNVSSLIIHAQDITKEKEMEEQRDRLISDLKDALAERKQAEEKLKELNEQNKMILETRVRNRTVELETANQLLEAEIRERERAEANIKEHQKRLRSLASELLLAEERQRRRIAIELHDNTCQELAYVLMELRNVRKAASEGSLESLDDVRGVIRKVVKDMRNMTFEICSPTLYEFGLEVAISELLADKLGPQDGISYHFNNDGKSIPLSDDIKIVTFQSVRELINNVIKHAQARNVEVDVRSSHETIKITVNDDGVGFNPDELTSPEHKNRGLGLFSIAERLKHIGGQFEFQSQPGQGSAFTLTAPLKADAEQGKWRYNNSGLLHGK